MASAYELRKRIDNFIEVLALSRVERFYSSALAKHLSISSSEAFTHLLERSGPGDQLRLMWEVRCPYCSRTLKLTDEKNLDDELICNCGEEFELDPKDFFPVFHINSDYKAFVKGEYELQDSKKKSNLNMKALQLT
ncbi:hypothetical protein [Peribacillus simplex]|uniref:hypothetical protein n=1 Tax=Peribacillus simplex TaxID=1478 RepID=UPI00333AA393